MDTSSAGEGVVKMDLTVVIIESSIEDIVVDDWTDGSEVVVNDSGLDDKVDVNSFSEVDGTVSV